ncbi:putative uncharacterized protein [Parachlamydia acanthamoebae UV-7]|jgi:hypothetical protein|uniref:Acyclic terpene utilisation N-terminal domain-containing protein n=2 Tax=Parachlamydia acanthamoebae TaxID=83552 RepID=F8KVS9_PARAV|nr:acyclic terpene utilization AtuA family protein [Parachlamydia acanthamoebae]EFB42167.1 hypothetical protein pah_c014o093 [Parachlamydia acanthamoebae str. Hall's coccus]CCB85215.1 putative uncharacterized protein [Parachlamydia acanthamoebae UV-7]
MDRLIRIANASAFWGDRPSAAATLLQQVPDLDYITLDYLAEVSLSIMAIQREKNPTLGYAKDFIETIRSLVPFWKKGSKVKIIANAGGLNPFGCAQECAKILKSTGCVHLKIGIVTGDDVLSILLKSPENFHNLETHASIETISPKLVTANAYLGASAIVEALQKGADIVITGRVADPSLTVAPAAFHFGWDLQDYDLLANATIAGHLIECGTQATGGILTDWLDLPASEMIGFPIIEMDQKGHFTLTKPPHTGGIVNLPVIKEQLLYEIGDPGSYLSPDVNVSFLNIQLQEEAPNRVRVSGGKGSPPPTSYKVSATYKNGYRADGLLTIIGRDADKKARKCGTIILERVKQAGYNLQDSLIECIGAGDATLGIIPQGACTECVLKVSAADENREALECFVKEFAPLVTSGPQGTTGYLTGRPKILPVFGYWPCLIDTKDVTPRTQTYAVEQLCTN